jgi:hypothetical protein
MLTESSTNGEIDVLTFYNAIEAIYARCRAGRQDRDGGGGGKKEGRAIVGIESVCALSPVTQPPTLA